MGFIPTLQTMEAKKLLQEKRTIVLKGNPGEGKTSTAFYLIDTDDYKNQRVVVKSQKDWKKVDTDWVKIVVLEDIFGQYDLDHGHLQEWIDSKYLQTMQSHIDVGKLQVIITIREDIHIKASSKLKSFTLFSGDMSLTLSSEKLKHSDKMSILNRVLERNNKVLNVDEKLQCISNFSGLIGFPQCCSLFVVYEDLFDQGPKFFRSPRKFLADNILNLNHISFLSLAFLFCNVEIEEESLSPSQKESKKYLPVLEDLASYLNVSFNKSTMTSLRDSYDRYSGLYVNKVFSFEHHSGVSIKKSFIQFSHATIYEVVGKVLGDRCPEMVVKYGDAGYLYERTYTAEAKDDTSVFIPVSVYGLMVERIIHDVVDKQLVTRIVKYSALQSCRFLRTLKDKLHTTNNIRDFLMANMPYHLEDLSEGKCFTFLQYILQNDKDVVSLVYEQFLEFLTCIHNNYSSACWQCQEKRNLLELALYYHHFEIVDKIIAMNAHYTHVSLCNAARHGDHSRVQTILEDLKRSQVFKPECSEAKLALCRAYLSGNQDVIEALLQEGTTLDSIHVGNVVQHGDINVVRKVVEHLKYHNKWNPDDEQCSKYFQTCVDSDMWDLIHYPDCHLEVIAQIPYSIALYMTYFNEKFDMAEYLIENDVKVSPSMLCYVSAYSSLQAVASMIHSLRVSGAWNPHCDDSSKALEKAYSENRHDIHDLLIKERVSLTMKNFPGVVKGVFVSLEFVKKALQHLKDTDNWDPKCSYAFQAFRKAYRNQKDDVCNLLIKEGVSLTMRDLSGVIMRSVEPSESVKMIIQHLKESDSWDPKCTDASKALEKAYGEHKYDVCDLLIDEGVSLTMKHLPCIILRSLDYVKTLVKQLQDTDSWDPKCDDASKALEKAYQARKYDVCDLLVQEGVSQTMKHLPHIILRSLDYLKTTVKHLQDIHGWYPRCSDATEALVKACVEQKHDVCNLLVQEGVTLTMKDIHYMMFRSIDCLKTSVKLLKDTDSWDPKCNDASEALEIAYSKQMHDVCDLLIHEGFSLTMKNLLGIIMREPLIPLESVKMAIQHLKNTKNWDPKCENASNTLERVCWAEKYDIYDLLVEEGVPLTMKNFLGVVMGFHVSLKSVKKAIQHLKGTKSWKSKCEDASDALEMAFGAQAYDVCDLLIQEGVSLSMKNFSGVIMRGFRVSLESVKKAIQHLKDIGYWDPKCNYAYEVLVNTYGEKMYEVCDLLIQEGVLLTMKLLPDMILRSLDFLKTSVKLLKYTNSWDPKCNDASEALEMAYNKQMYDVCDLLVCEGVSLTMKSLGVITRKPLITLKSAKMAIQHLKDIGYWDPKSDDACIVLVKAYEEKRYDVYELLIHEGVLLTMKHLSRMILRSLDSMKTSVNVLKYTDSWDHRCNYVMRKPLIPLKSVKKAIQHLKNTNSWDPKCEDAFNTLEMAFGAQAYDVCNLLIQNGVSSSMNILSSVIMRGFWVSLESVKKAIQHEKNIGYWDPMSIDACEVLVNAYGEKKYDVCNLLRQERVSLTMKHLPHMILRSLYFVKTSVDLLKVTCKWDYMCDDASAALEKAYRAQRYDVCDLLVDEGVSHKMKPNCIIT